MATNIRKNTAKLMMQKLQSELDTLFAEQQLLNGDSKGKPQGGLSKAQLGTEIDDPYGYGYTNLGNYSLGNMFQDRYKMNFNIPSLTNNAAWFQKPSAVYGSQSQPAGQIPFAQGQTIDPRFGMKRFDAYDDTESFKKDYMSNPVSTTDPTSKIKFSNPLDDPNSPLFNPTKSKADTLKAAGKGSTNWGKVGTFAGQVAPMLYNMFKGLQKPEKTTPNYNPYEDEIRSTMRNRRFNIDPTLNANRTAQAVSNRNISNVANSRGELMSNLGASQNYRMAGDAAAYAQKNNMDNQYLGEQAQMDAQLGGNRAAMDWGVQTANSQNRAVTNQFMSQGFNDLGRFAQTQQLMGNQQMRDAQLNGLYPDMFGVYKYMYGAQDIVNSTLKKPKKP